MKKIDPRYFCCSQYDSLVHGPQAYFYASGKSIEVMFIQVDDLRGSPMSVGSLEEIIDEK